MERSLGDTCYVELLNVHPARQRRSLTRRMLTQMVDWATDNGYRRVAIETWPGNLKSVPLYKRVGFFWTLDTDVCMENHIPVIRRLATARRFFELHDWYTTFRRELEQTEDDQRHPTTGNMQVYFRWEEDDEFLEVVVDRQGQAITGLDTVCFAVYMVVDEGKPAQGIAYPVRWRIKLAFCQVDGRHQDTVLYGEGFQRKRTPQMSWSYVGSWDAAVNSGSGHGQRIGGETYAVERLGC